MVEAVQLENVAIQEGPGSQTTVFTASRTCHGLRLLWAGELDAAREVLHQELTEYERLGRYVVRGELLTYLAEVECRAGNWNVAARHAQEAYDIDVEAGWLLGLGHLLFPRALVAAHTGDVDAARSYAEEGLRQSLRNEDMLDASCNRSVLGFLELSLRRLKRSSIAWGTKGGPSIGRGPSPPPGGAAGCSPRPGAICQPHARRWSKPWSSTGICRSPSSWPGPCW